MDKSVKITVVVAGVVILLAIGGMFLFRGNNAGASDTSNRGTVAAVGVAPAGGGAAAGGVAPGGATAGGGAVAAGPAGGSAAGSSSTGGPTGVAPDQQKYVDDELKK